MYRRAILASKAKVIKAIVSQNVRKGKYQLDVPAPAMGELNEAEATLKMMKADLENLSKSMGLQQGKVDAGPSIADKGNDLINAIIKSIDSGYDLRNTPKSNLKN